MTIDEMKNAIDNAMGTIGEDEREELYATLIDLDVAAELLLYLEEGGEWPESYLDDDIQAIFYAITD